LAASAFCVNDITRDTICDCFRQNASASIVGANIENFHA
jgi:hypothetical protein